MIPRNLPPLGKTTAPKSKNKRTTIHNPSLKHQNTKEGKAYLEPIRAMKPFDRLVHMIVERHKVHCKRYELTAGKTFGYPSWEGTEDKQPNETPAPWTDDPVLQSVFFCNPYRENDKVTAYLRDNFREEYKDKPCVFLGSILLRMFNYIPTMRKLINAGVPQRLGTSPKESLAALKEAKLLLCPQRDAGEQMFSGAYIIKFFNGMRKVEAGLLIMEELAKENGKKISLYDACCSSTMEETFGLLTRFHGMGPFYCYQFIGDLAYTHVLANADDWDTWSFCGPGTSRGSLRLKGINTKPDGTPFERRINIPGGWKEQLLEQKARLNEKLQSYDSLGNKIPKGKPCKKMPHIHMRDMTGCLCEFDKYERALNNERDLKRGYPGVGH